MIKTVNALKQRSVRQLPRKLLKQKKVNYQSKVAVLEQRRQWQRFKLNVKGRKKPPLLLQLQLKLNRKVRRLPNPLKKIQISRWQH